MKQTTIKTTWTTSMTDFAKDTLNRCLAKTGLNYEDADIKVTKLAHQIKVDISINGFIAQSINDDFYVAFTAAATKLKNLIIKHSKKLVDKHKHAEVLDFMPEEPAAETNTIIAKEKTFILEPCTLEEAVESFEQTDYSFYTFRDIDEDNVTTIVYRRKDDTLGIIRCK